MNNNQVLPTIAELANKTKVSTTQVCLRIKDSTKEFFEQQAAAYSPQTDSESSNTSKTTANSLMVSLLDSYAESYAVQYASIQNQINGMREYLHRQAQRVTHAVAHSADDRLLYRIYGPGFKDGHGDPDFQFCLENYSRMAELRNRYYDQEQEGRDSYDDQALYYEMHDDACSEFAFTRPVDGDTAPDAEYADLDDEPDAQWHVLRISYEKWLTVVAMVDAYARRIKDLTHDKLAGLTPDALRDMAEIINQTPKQDLAFKIADYLTDYMEQTYA